MDGGEAIREFESGFALPDGMRRKLGARARPAPPARPPRAARRLLALEGPPASPVARRLVAGLLGARPEALPDPLAPRELRPIEESAVAAMPLARASFAVVDVETTGLSSARDAIIEIGAVRARAERRRSP